MTYRSINILDAIEQIGESATQELISDFSCSKNQDIQHFLQHNAIDFAKRKISITHLVFDEEKRIVGYYTLTHKPLLISKKTESLSQNQMKRKSHDIVNWMKTVAPIQFQHFSLHNLVSLTAVR